MARQMYSLNNKAAVYGRFYLSIAPRRSGEAGKGGKLQFIPFATSKSDT